MSEKKINKLRKLKQELLEKAMKLRDELKTQEEKKGRPRNIPQIVIPDDVKGDDDDTENQLSQTSNHGYDDYELKICEAVRHVTGVKFENPNKTWLHDDVYIYKTGLVTKTINFFLELTVRLKNDELVEVLDITCHFINIDVCYMLEITPWVSTLTKRKNFSQFLSAISDYNEYSVSRSKFLYKVEKKGFATLSQGFEENGGIIADIHPPGKDQVYLQFVWCVMFSEQTWHIEHFLTITPTDIGEDFARKYSNLLSSFCKVGLKQKKLEELWTVLINAINEYDTSNSES